MDLPAGWVGGWVDGWKGRKCQREREREREGGAEKNKMDTINCRDREIK